MTGKNGAGGIGVVGSGIGISGVGLGFQGGPGSQLMMMGAPGQDMGSLI